MSVNAQPTYVQIPVSSYSFWDIFGLSTLIETQLNAQIPGYNFTVTLGGNNNKFVIITATTAFKLSYSQTKNQNQIAQYLGFGNGINTNFNNFNTTQTALFPYNVQPTANINLQLQNLAMNTETIGVIAQIPLSAPVTQMIQYQTSYYEQHRHILLKSNTIAVQNLVIALLDDNGNKMDIQDNRLSMTLVFETYNTA